MVCHISNVQVLWRFVTSVSTLARWWYVAAAVLEMCGISISKTPWCY